MEDIAEELVNEVESLVEETFTPKPGGIIDKFRQDKARREALQHEMENRQEPIEELASYAVKTVVLSPEQFRAGTFTIQPSGKAPILPRSRYRSSATLMVITSNATVILASTEGDAISGNGFTLPYGIPMRVYGRGILYAYNNTGATVQVSVLSELYARETA